MADRVQKELFGQYGPVRSVFMKTGFAFVEFDESRDADEAIAACDRYPLHGRPLRVEIARGRERRADVGADACFKCGQPGHWANECPQGGGGGPGGMRTRGCFNCGQEGHIARECPEPRRDGGRGPPPRRGPSAYDDGYAAPPRDAYGAPPRDAYSAPPPRDAYGAPPPRDYGGGAPPPPRGDAYGAPPPRDSYGAPPPPRDSYGGPPPPRDAYGAPPPRDAPPPSRYDGESAWPPTARA